MSAAQAPRPRWARLARELRRLRDLSGVTQRQMASALKVSQATINRIEAGGAKDGKPPPWPQVQAWAEACAAAEPDLDLLRDMTEDALAEHNHYGYLGGPAAAQEDTRGKEAAARTIRNYSNVFIPGLLQTAQYARRVLTGTDYRQAGGIAEAVQGRLQRQEILHEEGRRLDFIVDESDLRRRVIPAPALAVQLAHLADAASLPSVTLAVIPDGVPIFAMAGFVIYEDLADGRDPWVDVELGHTLVTTSKPEDVEFYRDQYELLKRQAVHGDEAVTLIRWVARTL